MPMISIGQALRYRTQQQLGERDTDLQVLRIMHQLERDMDMVLVLLLLLLLELESRIATKTLERRKMIVQTLIYNANRD